MVYSYSYYKNIIKDYLIKQFDKDATILDVGPSCGTYYDLLNDYFTTFDGVEAFAPNMDRYDLRNKYRNVYNKDNKDFDEEYMLNLIIPCHNLEE